MSEENKASICLNVGSSKQYREICISVFARVLECVGCVEGSKEHGIYRSGV